MAGTGHSYEIGNVSRVRETIHRLAEGFSDGPGKEWLFSRKVLRHLTSPSFTFPVNGGKPDEAAELFDPDERDLLADKVRSGKEVRLFSPEVFAMSQADGGGLGHVADWIMWLSANDPRLYAKLPRITVEQAVLRAAEDWAGISRSNKPHHRGHEELVLDTPSGRKWVELLDHSALHAEGYAMSHCVGTYSLGSTTRIMSLRDRAGRSIVTVEFRMKDGAPFLVQARAFANAPVPGHAQHCLAALMECLNAGGDLAAEAAGVCRGKDGKWARIVETWERVSWMGMEGVAAGNSLVLMSPRNPALALLKVAFSGPGWRTGGTDGNGRVSALEDRHFHIDEQRAFAAVKNAVLDKTQTGLGPELVVVEGRLVPRRDAMERRVVDGVTCLVEKVQKGEAFHVVHSKDDARTLLRIEPDTRYRSLKPSLMAVPLDEARWSLTEARRCMAVMTVMDIHAFANDAEHASADCRRAIYRRYRPVRSAAGRWSLFLDEAECIGPLTGCPGSGWRFTSERAELVFGKYGSVTVEKGREGGVASISASLAGREAAEEIAAFLNRMDWPPARRIHGCWSPEGLHSPVFHLRGQWRATVDVDGFIKEATGGKRSRRIRRMPEAEAEAVFSVLSDQHVSEDADFLLASALDAWSKVGRKKDGVYLSIAPAAGYLAGPQLRWSTSYEGRLMAAARLWPLFGERTRRRLERIAAATMREALKGWRRQYFHPRLPTVARLLESFHGALADSLFVRAMKRALYERKIPVLQGAAAPHPAWFGALAERAAKNGCHWDLKEACDHTTTALKDDAVLSLAEAGVWLECFRTASARSWHFHATRNAGKLVAAVERSAGASPEDWAPLVEEARSLKALIEARENGWNRAAA